MSESVKPSIRETLEADLALAGEVREFLDAEVDAPEEKVERLTDAVPDYASRLLRVLDLCDEWERTGREDLRERAAELRRAIEGAEG